MQRRAGLDRDRAFELSTAFGDEPDDPRKDDPFDVAVWRPSGEAASRFATRWRSAVISMSRSVSASAMRLSASSVAWVL